MSENIPPSSTAPANSNASAPATTADQPGRPYYESLRTTLRQTLDKKRKLDDELAGLEEQIFKAESTYLEETANSGNIVRGFDGWVKGVQVGGGGGGGGGRGGAGDDRRRGRVRDEDRVFSRSSVSWTRAQEGPDSNTPSHAPTPTSSIPPQLLRGESNAPNTGSSTVKAPNKKKRPTEKDEEDDGKTVKRGKITYSRE